MRLLCVVVVAVASLLTEHLALPVGKEGHREDVVARCLAEVLSKALSKPDSQLDQECKDILRAGVKHAPLDKKTAEWVATHGEGVKGQPEAPKGVDVKDIEDLLKSVEERSQESLSPGGEKEERRQDAGEVEREKRSSWRPGRFHQRKHKRGEEEEEEGEDEEDEERSQESWGLEEKRSEGVREKRAQRPGRYRYRKYKRDEESLGGEKEEDEEEEERSQESWDVGKREVDDEEEEERQKRIWKPTHRYHHKKKFNKRADEEEEEDEEVRERRAQRPGKYRYRKYKRDEESLGGEEEEEERSQESWALEEKRSEDEGGDEEVRERRAQRPGKYRYRKYKRDEESLGGEKEEDEEEEERSQESWDVGKIDEEEEERQKRIWKPTHRYHHKKKFHKRADEEEEEDGERSQESWALDKRGWRAGRFHQRRHHKRDEEEAGEEAREEPDEERSQESWGLDKRSGKEEAGLEKRIWKPSHRYHHKNKFHKRGGGEEDEEEQREEDEEDEDEATRYLAEKRSFRGFSHPAWYKRESDPNKMDELAKLLSFKMNQLAQRSHQEAPRRSAQRAGGQQEENALDNLAAMDTELQKIAAKLHDNAA